LLAFVFLIALASGSRPCLAVEAEDDPAAAKAHFSRGTRLFEVGEYREALVEFKSAHLAKPDPAFIYNIAQCHRQLGDLEQAATMYRRFLAASPNARNRADVEKRVADIEADLEAAKQKLSPEPLRAPPPQPVPPTPLPAAPQADPPPPQAPPAGVAPSAVEVAAEPKPSHSILSLRTLRWAGAGLTAALAAGAITTGILAKSKYDDLKGSCGKTPVGCSSGSIDGVKTRALITNVLWGLAGAAAIGTGVMFYMTPHEASAQLAWRF
jgi:tetratricopeptide (TPR) repeat protein